MKIRLLFCAGALFAIVGAVKAGPAELESKEIAPQPTIAEADHWQFNLGSPGWLASVSGEIGLKGISSDVSVDFDQILRHIDYAASLSAEARKGRFGFYSDLLYLEASDALYTNGMLSKVNIGLSEYIVGPGSPTRVDRSATGCSLYRRLQQHQIIWECSPD